MTREEAIEVIKETRFNINTKINDTTRFSQALEIAIDALEREETVTEFADRCKECGARYGKLLKQKSGKWIRHDINYTTTSHSIYYDCFLCGCAAPCTETADKILWKLSNYCPDCGAEMKNGGQWR